MYSTHSLLEENSYGSPYQPRTVNYEQGRCRGQGSAGEEDGLAIPVNALTSEVWAMWWEAGAQPAVLAPIHTDSLCETHWPRRKCIVLAQILPDVTRQWILVFKSSITQRWLTWGMTSS